MPTSWCDQRIDELKLSLQELLDVLWAARELRKGGYTMETAGKIGLAETYAEHGAQALTRWLNVASDNAIHNAKRRGMEPTRVRNLVN